MIRFHCGQCRQALEAHSEDVSRPAVCPCCGRAFTVPPSSSRSDDEVGRLVSPPPGGAAPAAPSGRPLVLDALPVEPEDLPAPRSARSREARGRRFPGKVIRTFGGNRSWAVLAGVVGAANLALCLSVVTWGVLMLTGHLAPVKDPTGMAIVGVLFGCFTVGCFFLAARSWGAEAVVTETGLGVAYPFSAPTFYPWEKIRAVYENNRHHMATFVAFSPSAKNYRLRIVPFRGSSHWLSSYCFSAISELSEVAQQEMVRVCLPELRARLRDGEEVRFGPVSLDDRGLTYRDDLYRWGELGGVRIDTDSLCVVGSRRGDVWCKVPLHEVPNPRLLKKLMEDYLDGREG